MDTLYKCVCVCGPVGVAAVQMPSYGFEFQLGHEHVTLTELPLHSPPTGFRLQSIQVHFKCVYVSVCMCLCITRAWLPSAVHSTWRLPVLPGKSSDIQVSRLDKRFLKTMEFPVWLQEQCDLQEINFKLTVWSYILIAEISVWF